MRRTVLAGLLGTSVALAVLLLAVPAELFGRVPAMTGSLQASPAYVAVVDGQTLRLHETVVRLQGVTAPRRGSDCGPAPRDCGAASSEALAGLVRGREVSCKLYGRDAAGFLQGLCVAGGIDVNRSIVSAGWARAEPVGAGASDFADVEAQAREARRGLWRDGRAAF